MRKGTCRHYRSPIHCESCDKGINYLKLSNGEREGYLRRLPCVKTSLSVGDIKCEMYEDPSDKEIKEWNDFVERKIQEMDAQQGIE